MAYKIMSFEGADFYDFNGQLAPKYPLDENGEKRIVWSRYKIRLDDSLLLDRFDQVLKDRKMKKKTIFPYIRKVGEDKYARCDNILCTDQIIHMKFKVAVYTKALVQKHIMSVKGLDTVSKVKCNKKLKVKKPKLKTIRVDKVKSPDDVRREIYEKGVTIGNTHYVRWIHSSSNARSGVAYFINEELLNSMNNFTDFGLNLKETSEVNIADVEATRGLLMSQKIGLVDIKPKNILVVKDCESTFTERVMKTSLDANYLITEEVDDIITNTIFDGQSLMDKSLFPDEYKDKGMLLLRHKAFKSCCFNANVQQWFKDNGITDISQLNGIHTPDAKLEDIKLITTESSIKYKKFGGDNWFLDWCNEITRHKSESEFGIVKYEKPTKYFDGRLVKTNYQILNTIYIEDDDLKELLEPTIDYMKKLQKDPILMYHHCKQYKDKFNETNESFVYSMLDMNMDYAKTSHYGAKAQYIINKIRGDAKRGKLLVKGNFSTMLSCPIEMLKESIGMFDGTSTLAKGTIVTKSFGIKKLVVCRNPHICAGNIYIPLNVRNELIEHYVNLSDNIVVVNTINENIMQRLGGADFDSDQVMIIDNDILLKSAQKRYKNYLVPTTKISPVRLKENYTMKNLAETDIKIANNLIGEIVNLSQILNSHYWDVYSDKKKRNENELKLKDIYKDICQLSIMSMFEIDKAKRNYDSIDTTLELDKLKSKYNLKKPLFFKEVDKHKKDWSKDSKNNDKKKDNKKEKYKPYNTTCDKIYKKMNGKQIVTELDMDKPVEILVNRGLHYRGRVDTELIDKLGEICKKRKSEEITVNNSELEDKEKTKQKKEIKEQFVNSLNVELPKLKNINLSTARYIVNSLESETKEKQDIPEYEFEALLEVDAKALPKLISHEENTIPKLVYDQKGTTNIYGIGFRVAR